MKKIFTLTFTVLVFIANQTMAQLNTLINNGDFETWTSNTKATGWGGYIDAPVLIFNTPTYGKETAAPFAGTTSMLLTTTDFSAGTFGLVGVREGLAFTGSISGGRIVPAAYTGINRPSAVNLVFKYEPQNGDTGAIVAYFFKWNANDNKRDTIGFGGVLLNQDVPNYISYNFNIGWQASGIPDSMCVIMVSSAGFTPQVNSKMWVDNVGFTFPTGLNKSINEVTALLVFPNPAQNTINLSKQYTGASFVNYAIIDLAGREVTSGKLAAGQNTINIEELTDGNYFLKVTSSETEQPEMVKFSVIR